MQINELLQAPDQDLTVFRFRVMREARRWQSKPDASRQSHWQLVIAGDPSGSTNAQMEVKIWSMPDVIVGKTYEFTPNTNGTGVALVTDTYTPAGGTPKNTKQVVIQGSAVYALIQDDGFQQDNAAAAQQQRQQAPPTESAHSHHQNQTTSQSAPAAKGASKADFRKKVIFDIAQLYVQCQVAVEKYIVPQVTEECGHVMEDGERQAAVASMFITSKDILGGKLHLNE